VSIVSKVFYCKGVQPEYVQYIRQEAEKLKKQQDKQLQKSKTITPPKKTKNETKESG
jgi:hypothetical protein